MFQHRFISDELLETYSRKMKQSKFTTGIDRVTKAKYNKFVKTDIETVKKDNSEYILHLDSISKQEKRDILIKVCKRKVNFVNQLNDYLLDREFSHFVFRSIKDIERDLYQVYT